MDSIIKEQILNCKSYAEAIRILYGKNYTNGKLQEKVRQDCLNNGIDFQSVLEKNNTKHCLNCGKILELKSQSKFCSSSCAAKINNTKRKKEKYCINCGTQIDNNQKFCSNKCQCEFKAKEITNQWLNNEHSGCDKNGELSEFVRRYVLELHEHKCDVCGFNEKNPFSGNEILEIHHIDGDCFNNNLSNLQVLCPTHHAMTYNYGRRNYNCTRKRYKK